MKKHLPEYELCFWRIGIIISLIISFYTFSKLPEINRVVVHTGTELLTTESQLHETIMEMNSLQKDEIIQNEAIIKLLKK